MNVGKRIEKIVSMCPIAQTAADVGCDHGRTACELVLRGKAEKVFATDISLKCVKKALDLSRIIGIERHIITRVGNGLEPLYGEKIDYAVISGMGSVTIRDIMENDRDNIGSFVISPNSQSYKLRKWLLSNRYIIEREAVVGESGKYYPIMIVSHGSDVSYTEQELLIGRNTERSEDFYSFMQCNVDYWKNVDTDKGKEMKRFYESLLV